MAGGLVWSGHIGQRGGALFRTRPRPFNPETLGSLVGKVLRQLREKWLRFPILPTERYTQHVCRWIDAPRSPGARFTVPADYRQAKLETAVDQFEIGLWQGITRSNIIGGRYGRCKDIGPAQNRQRLCRSRRRRTGLCDDVRRRRCLWHRVGAPAACCGKECCQQQRPAQHPPARPTHIALCRIHPERVASIVGTVIYL